MKLLALDTTAKAASVCIADGEKTVGEFFVNTALTHSQTLMPMTEQLLSCAGFTADDIDAVAVNAGPGSFTGVRIGVAAAKGIAFPRSLPCVAVSTLESMAYNMLGSHCIVCAVMDARCSQVYNALFEVNGEEITRLCEDRALSLEDLRIELERYNGGVVLVGDGAEITFDYLKDKSKGVTIAPLNRRIQTASSTALAALKKINNGETLSASELMPVYLRLPQAQRELNKRMGV